MIALCFSVGPRCGAMEGDRGRGYDRVVAPFGLAEIRVRGFRSLLDVTLRPGAITAPVGEARAGKSNLLAAVRALVDPAAPMLTAEDVSREGDGRIRIEGELAVGRLVTLSGAPLDLVVSREGAPPVLFLPAALRSGQVVADPSEGGERPAGAARLLEEAIRGLISHRRGPSDATSAGALVRGMESCCEARQSGALVLIEEPELFLRPHTQRYLYRLLRELASAGNQVIYSAHAPAFLNVARLEEFALVQRPADGVTRIVKPGPLEPGEEFRVMSEFDAERSELFLSRAAILVEGRTERLALPFVFRALGHDVDRESISIVECGGRAQIPLFVGICRAVGVPFVVLHDRDAPTGSQPSPAERALNALIRETADPERTVVMEPDFEAVAGLRGHRRKPERAWLRFQELGRDDVPPSLKRVVGMGRLGGQGLTGLHAPFTARPRLLRDVRSRSRDRSRAERVAEMMSEPHVDARAPRGLVRAPDRPSQVGVRGAGRLRDRPADGARWAPVEPRARLGAGPHGTGLRSFHERWLELAERDRVMRLA